MATISRTRRTTDERSGGKLFIGRRIAAAAKTPYERPLLVATRSSTRARLVNPDWVTGLIFLTSRMIATGAAKLLSSLFGSGTSLSSDSDSSSGWH